MGASPTKLVINSLPSNLAGLNRRGSQRGRSEGSGMLVPVRSNSLDSISTVLSSGTNHLSRASSLDSIPTKGRHTHSQGKQYTLLDNISVASSIDGSSQEGKSHTTRENPLTEQKLELSRMRSDPFASCVRESDEFSDNFVEASEVPLGSAAEHSKDSSAVTMDPRPSSLPAKSILKESKSLLPLEPGAPDNPHHHDGPQLAATIRSKLTSEEWAQVISYTCASLEKCLQQDLIKPLNEGGSPTEARETTSDTPANKRVTINEEVSTSMYERGSVVAGGEGTTTVQALSTQERPRKHRERPRSLPPVYWREDELWGVEEQHRGYTRARANSHEDSYYYRCTTEPSKPRTRKHDPNRSRRSRKSTRSQRNPNAPVDPSIDDNCPGVEKYRRPHHRHTHNHTLVSQHVDRGERRAIKDKSCEVSTDYKDKAITMSLRDMKDAAVVLKHSAEVAGTKALHEVVSMSNSYPGQGPRKRHSFKLRSKHASIEDQPEVEVGDSSLVHPVEEEGAENWDELMFPNGGSHSASGRDSPATDMAVMDLNLDHPVMMLPTRSRMNNRSAVIAGTFQAQGHRHSHSKKYLLHSHNHFHHIIHHSRP